MHQNLWKPAPVKTTGGQRTRRRTFWPEFFWYPLVSLVVLMMVLALRLGVGHALEGHSWQKVRPAAGFVVYAATPSPKWNKPLTTLTSDNDDDDDDDGDDCPPTTTT